MQTRREFLATSAAACAALALPCAIQANPVERRITSSFIIDLNLLPKKFPHDVAADLIGHTSDPQYETIAACRHMELFRDKTITAELPLNKGYIILNNYNDHCAYLGYDSGNNKILFIDGYWGPAPMVRRKETAAAFSSCAAIVSNGQHKFAAIKPEAPQWLFNIKNENCELKYADIDGYRETLRRLSDRNMVSTFNYFNGHTKHISLSTAR